MTLTQTRMIFRATQSEEEEGEECFSVCVVVRRQRFLYFRKNKIISTA